MIARVIRMLDQQRQDLDRRIAQLIESDDDWRATDVTCWPASPASVRSPPRGSSPTCRNWASSTVSRSRPWSAWRR
jgi:hypothetical protein